MATEVDRGFGHSDCYSSIMKIALTIWNQRIAPVFDVAASVKLVEIEGNSVQRTETRSLDSGLIPERFATLHEWGVQVLICGAISGPAQTLAQHHHIELHAFVSGEEQEVLQAWMDNKLDTVSYVMPGCRRRGQGRQCRHRRGRYS